MAIYAAEPAWPRQDGMHVRPSSLMFLTTTPPIITMPLMTSRLSTAGGGWTMRVLSSTPPISGHRPG